MSTPHNTDRLLFAPTITSRSPIYSFYGPSKFQDDMLFTNGLAVESPGEPLYLKSRPGLTLDFEITSNGTEGRGVGYWSTTDSNYYVIDSTVYKESTALDGKLTTTTGYVQFTTALSNSGLLLFQDGVKLYSIDSSDKMTCINATAWAATTAYVAGDFVTNDTNKVYICTTGGTSAGSGGPTGTGSSIADNTVVWDYVNTVTGGSNIPSAMVPGLVVLDQYVFVADANGNIYNSNEGDAFTWTAGDQINSELLADNLVGIARHINYLIAFGEYGTELFYNAANPNGSPISRLEGTFSYIGCYDGNTIVNADQDTVWVSQNQIGVLDVVVMKGLEIEKITTAAITEAINQEKDNEIWEAYYYNLFGRRLYVLNLIYNTSFPRNGQCYVLDIDTKLWYVWDYTRGPAAYRTSNWPARGAAKTSTPGARRNIQTIARTNTGTTVLNGPVLSIYARSLREDSFADSEIVSGASSGLPLEYTIQTAVWDAGNSANKFIHRIDLLGDTSAGDAMVSWQDEDYRALFAIVPTFTTGRPLALYTSGPKKLHRCGTCVRRRFKISVSSANTAAPLPRLLGLDIYYTQGTPGRN